MNPLLSRRHFLKTSALATASAPFWPSLVRAVEPKRQIGFAICGLGSLSTHQIAPALLNTQYCKLTGIITGTPAKAQHWQAQYNIPDHNVYNYDTMAKMADNPDIDVVYVVTPNGLHADHTIAAAKAGKHVLCEKPMEVSPERCQQMIDACKAAGKLLAIGYRLHFDPYHLECIRLLREKVLGELKYIDAAFGFSIGDPKQWRLKKALSGGGPMMDVGIYALQAMRYLSGEEPVEVTALATTIDPVKFRDIEESLTWQMKFPSGILANGTTTYGFGGLDNFKATTEHGWVAMGTPAYDYHGLKASRSDGQAIQLGDVDQFVLEMDDFAQCILENKPTRVPGEEGLRDMKIITAIYESARTGKAVTLA